ncbi:DNA-processing protein DprA [Mycoplasmopsis gallopavonis]|uniref:DNA processing protein n=1 Tax=Mycoplasmopsis gallopavonis TaxID=76629 RepID=A0A449AZK1_9BACT|nr:DNA-processing protein DprA [Mycoplasmopsis gallopavonis]RIV16791.1 DNA processing protein [Mycoplasmopsis gallopavonis]VEU72914.1 Putative DNA processing protein [Mycoplasmopsis gallopavonis]
MNNLLLYLSHSFQGDIFKIHKWLQGDNKISNLEVQKIQEEYRKLGIKFLTPLDWNFPISLFNSNFPPFVIFYYGNIKLLNKEKLISIINEIVDFKTDFFLKRILKIDFSKTVLVVGNYKKSEQRLIDEVRKRNGQIIQVLAGGIDQVLDADRNWENELVLSIFPIKTHPQRHYFKQVNHLIASISQNLIVISSIKNSKTHNLVNAFLSYGKQIYCFPGLNIEDGNTQLLKDGATLITDIHEI